MFISEDGLRLNKKDASDSSSEEFLFINNCGHHIIKHERIEELRPKGRSDYQLLYIVEGQGEYYFDGSFHMVTSGNLVLYRPWNEQHYYYDSKDSQLTSVYWIHFSGTCVDRILEQSGFIAPVNFVGVSVEIQNIWERIFQFMQENPNDYQLMCQGYFLQLMALLKQKANSRLKSHDNEKMAEIEKIISTNYFHEYTNEELAQRCNMSVSHFIKLFKDAYHYSPRNYRLMIQLDYAQQYLRMTSMPIQSIAKTVGFTDALYFSRIFKKYIGKSPIEYRLDLKEQDKK